MIFLSGPLLCPSEVKGDKIGLYWLNVVSSHSYIGGATAPPDSGSSRPQSFDLSVGGGGGGCSTGFQFK